MTPTTIDRALLRTAAQILADIFIEEERTGGSSRSAHYCSGYRARYGDTSCRDMVREARKYQEMTRTPRQRPTDRNGDPIRPAARYR